MNNINKLYVKEQWSQNTALYNDKLDLQ